MDESPHSSPREKIMAKMLAAQEQKLRDIHTKTEGSSEIQEIKQTMAEAQNAWNEERKLLVDLLEKNQKLTQSTQGALLNEKKEIEEHHRKLEESLRSRINQLKEENTILRESSGRAALATGPTPLSKKQKKAPVQSKNQLFKEIERVEMMFENKESDFITKINQLTNELKQQNDRHKSKTTQLRLENEALQSDLTKALKEKSVIENHMSKELEFIKTKLDQQSKIAARKEKEVEDVRQEYEDRFKSLLNQKNEGEDIWTSERKRLVHDKNLITQILEVKEKTIDSQLTVRQQQSEQTLAQLKEQIVILKQEKSNLEEKLEKLEAISADRDESNYNENQRLKQQNTLLIETSEQRESAFQAQLNALLQQVSQMKESYTEREQAYVDETKRLTSDLDRYHALLDEACRKGEADEGLSVNYYLQKEIEALHGTLDAKTEELVKLRNLYISEKHSERQSITKCVTTCYSWLDSIRKEHTQQTADRDRLIQELKGINEIHTAQEIAQAQELKTITQEMSAVNLRLAKYESGSMENENRDLRARTASQETELTQLRQVNATQLSTIQTLEELIQSKQSPDEEMTTEYADQFKKNQLELARLADENEALAAAKKSIEEACQAQLHEVYERLETTSRELKKTQDMRDKARAIRAKRSLDELTAWSTRQQAMKRQIGKLEEQIKNSASQKAVYAKLQRKITELEADELKMLRVEVNQKEQWAQEFQETIESEKVDLVEELERLRAFNTATQERQQELTKMIADEYEILHTQRKSYEEREASRVEQITVEQETFQSVVAMMKQSEERILASSRTLLTSAREEAAALDKNLAIELELHQGEMQALREMTDNDMLILTEKVKVLEKLTAGQKKQIQEVNNAFDMERDGHAAEIKQLRTEVANLRKTSNQKSEVLARERQKITEELERLSTLINVRESALNKSFTEKITTMRKIITKKNAVINETQNKLRSERYLQNRTVGSYEDIFEEVSGLKAMEEERVESRRSEREAMNTLVSRLRKSVTALSKA